MNTMIYSKLVRTSITFIFTLWAFLGPPTINASAQDVTNPFIRANPSAHVIYAHDWPINVELTLTIGTYTDTSTTVFPPWDPNIVVASFDLTGRVDLVPGNVVTITGGGYTKSLTITDFAVTELNVETNTLSGRASPGGSVCAGNVNVPGDYRCTTAGIDGNWVLPPVSGGFVLATGVYGTANEIDLDNDQTFIDWRVPNPRFDVGANSDQVQGWEWKIGDTVTLQVGGQSIEQTVGVAPWDPNLPYVEFNLQGIYDIQPGDVVSLSNGTITKTTIVTAFEITGFDVEADTVSGIAQPGSNMDVWACNFPDCQNVYRHVTADVNGNWLADFAKPGIQADEQNTFNIIPGTWVDSQQVDEDGDATKYGKNVPNPHADVRANFNQVQGFEWTMGETVTLQVGGHSIEQTVGVTPWDPNQSYVEFNLQGVYDIQPGDVVSLSNGTITKTTTVTTLEFTGLDVDADTVSGIAAPGSNIDVWACNYSDCQFVYRHVTADGDGNWLADFSSPGTQADEQNTLNILGGTWVDSSQVDEDGDSTKYGMNVPNPRFDADAHSDQVQGWDWTEGETVTLQVSGQSFEQTVGVAPWDPNQPYVQFNLQGVYDIQPGDVISLSNGTITKTTTVTTLKITSFDVVADTIRGGAAPGSNVDLWINTPLQNFYRHFTADVNGNWLADFSKPGTQSDEQNTYDLRLGDWVYSQQTDTDGDATAFVVPAAYPSILAQITDDWFRVTDFASNATLTYEIYASKGGTRLLKGTIQSDFYGSVDTWVGDQVNLIPGNYLVVSDGSTTKALVLEYIKFDTFDLSNGLVEGSAPPPEGRYVWVGDGTENNGWYVDLNTDSNNKWSGNIAAPVPLNILWAAAQIFDEDGDASEVHPTLVLADVTIDIRPWIDPNIFLCGTPGELVPVSVLSTSEFDATTLDARNVRFGGTGTEAAVVLVGKDKKPMSYVADVNKDGLMDIVFTFRFGNTGFNCSDIPTGQHWANVNGMLTGMIGNMRVEGADVLKLYKLASQIK